MKNLFKETCDRLGSALRSKISTNVTNIIKLISPAPGSKPNTTAVAMNPASAASPAAMLRNNPAASASTAASAAPSAPMSRNIPSRVSFL